MAVCPRSPLHRRPGLRGRDKDDKNRTRATIVAVNSDTATVTALPHPILFSCAGKAAEALPRCSGVYRFYSEDGNLLYIGKSVDIHSRYMQHLNEGRKPGRHQRLMSQVRRVDCQLTAGEIGALLLENAAIKAEVPLFNRKQRRLRKLWTIQLIPSTTDFLQPQAIDFAPTGSRDTDTFGLYANKHRLTQSLQDLARDHALCLRVMGLDRGKGPCFQYQLGHCDGACAGKETATSHNTRLLEHLARQRIVAWPFAGPILLVEHTIHPVEQQPEHQFHLVDQWAWRGCFNTPAEANAALEADTPALFDRDAYRLIYSAIFKGRVGLQDPLSGEPLVNPLLATARLAS